MITGIKNRLLRVAAYVFSSVKGMVCLFKRLFPFILIPFEVCALYILRPFIHIRIGELESRAIGHFSLPIEIYLCEIDMGIHGDPNQFHDVYFFNETISNCTLAEKWSQYFSIKSSYLLAPLYGFLLRFFPQSRTLAPYRHWKTSPLNWQQFDLHRVLDRTSPHLFFTPLEIEQGELALQTLGLSPNSEFIGFFARDPLFRGGPKASPGFRDSNIFTQLPAMQLAVSKGFQAVRLGRQVKVPLGAPELSGIFDYSNSAIASDFNDVYFCSRLKFMVTTGSGLEALALCFRKPLVCVNIAQWGRLAKHNDGQYVLFIPKRQIWRATGVPLTLTEILRLNSHKFTSGVEYLQLGIELQDNTPEEITDAVAEMIDFLRNGKRHTDDFSNLQKEFQKMLFDSENSAAFPIRIGTKYLASNNFLSQ